MGSDFLNNLHMISCAPTPNTKLKQLERFIGNCLRLKFYFKNQHKLRRIYFYKYFIIISLHHYFLSFDLWILFKVINKSSSAVKIRLLNFWISWMLWLTSWGRELCRTMTMAVKHLSAVVWTDDSAFAVDTTLINRLTVAGHIPRRALCCNIHLSYSLYLYSLFLGAIINLSTM